MKYKILTDEEQDDILASFLLGQERDHYCHEINEQRYEEMLPTLPDGAFKERIATLLKDTKERKKEVEHILTKTHAQIAGRDKDQFDAAIAKVRAKKPMG